MFFSDQAVRRLDCYQQSWQSQPLVHIRSIPPAGDHETGSNVLHSDDEDDPGGWDRWHTWIRCTDLKLECHGEDERLDREHRLRISSPDQSLNQGNPDQLMTAASGMSFA